MWIKLKTIQYLSDKNGRQVTRYPGEWVNVGKHLARSWLAAGDAERPDQPDLQALPGCGLVVPQPALAKAQAAFPGLDIIVASISPPAQPDPPIPRPKTLYWDPAASLRPELVSTGFHLLETWEVAAPLYAYETLARDLGDQADRERTAAVIHDLRVPVYDPRVLYLNQCPAARRLLEAWAEESRPGGDRQLAFLRALYRVKPLILALPVTWILKIHH